MDTTPINWKVQLFKLNFDEQENRAVKSVLDSAWITMGQNTIDFEKAYADLLGENTMTLAVSSGTAALHMALLALGIGQGDEVITPSLTFVADQNTTFMVGAENVLADITSMEDWAMDPADIEAKITPKTKAVMIVHYAGFACDMERIVEICKKHNLYLIEDCAHTPGATYKNHQLGTFGDVAAFSFFTNKNLSVGEGGMVATKNPEIFEKLKGLRSHGMSQPSFDRYKGRAISYDIQMPGLNYRIDEMRAALGLVQLKKLSEANKKRTDLVQHYYSLLDGVEGISIPFRNFNRGTPNFHIMPVMLDEKIDRMKVIQKMKADGIQTSIHYPAIQKFTAYDGSVNPTPKAEYVTEHELTLPLYPTMTFEEVGLVCESLKTAVTGKVTVAKKRNPAIRFFDILFSGIAIIVLLPFMIPIMIGLKLTGEHDIFYKQPRIGKGGKEFGVLKFATMLRNSPNMPGGVLTQKDDPRILPMGKFLRKTKINELPQLLNIFVGQMSVIGPRPQAKRHYDLYSDEVKAYIDTVPPGLSGLGSVVFRDEEALLDSVDDRDYFHDNFIAPYKGELEVWFVKHRNLGTYFKLILLTILTVLKPSSSAWKKSFKDLPPVPIELEKYITPPRILSE